MRSPSRPPPHEASLTLRPLRPGPRWHRHPNLLEIRLIPTKKDIAFVEYADEASATAAKDALHNFKIDGETKMKVRARLGGVGWADG